MTVIIMIEIDIEHLIYSDIPPINENNWINLYNFLF
jgi:hypothetical protein